jgi:RNA polymerase sigma factor (sigma-70 family)
MATTQLGTLLRHIEQLTASRAVHHGPDRQLLDDFAARRDEAAFAALVSRHGPMVWRVCRRVLHHEQDAEDAFQATFLVLARNTGSIRQRDTLGNWLHGVAYRTAMKAKRSTARRRNHEARLRAIVPQTAARPTWDETQAVLDEEIQHLLPCFREAFVRCVLEGKSSSEAAVELGCKEGTVKSRVKRARRRLQQQLARRGIKLAALLAALSVAESAARAALPATLTRTTIRFGLLVAAGSPAAGLIPSHVAALATAVTRAMLLTKAKIATAVVFAIGILSAAGAWTHQALRARENEPAAQAPAASDKPAPPAAKERPKPVPADTSKEAVTCSGRVLGPNGKPCAGANLYLVGDVEGTKERTVRATTGADGRFRVRPLRSEFAGPQNEDGWPFVVVVATAKDHGPDWPLATEGKDGELTLRLVRNEVTIQGRVVDLQGKPVAGAVIHVRDLATTPEEDLALVLKTWQIGEFGAALELASKVLFDPVAAGLPKSATTGRDGRFRLPGAGRERMVSLSIEAPDIASETIRVVPRPAAEVRALVQAGARASLQPSVVPSAGPPLYGRTFDHVASPSRPVTGTVRDWETRQLLAGVEISGHAAVGHWEDVRAVTDDRGHYRLAGLPNAGRYRLYAQPKEGSGYLPVGTEAVGGDGLEALRVDFAVPLGVEVRGRVTDKRTGQPIPYVGFRYAPLQGNRHPGVSAYRFKSLGQSADGQGAFRLVLPPGPGVLFAVAQTGRDDNRYTQARLAFADQDKAYKDSPDEAFLAGGGRIETLYGTNTYRLLDLAADAKTVTCDLELDPGLTQTGTVLGPDGQPLVGAAVLGLTAVWPKPASLRDAGFTAVALDTSSPRDLLFIHAERKLDGHLTLRGDEKETPAVKLEPWGALVGRVVDADGQPLAGVRMQVTYPRYIPVAWMERHPEEIQTDRDGRLRVERLMPRMKISLGASAGKAFLLLGNAPNGLMQVSVAAGETKDLGDLRAKTSE